MVPAGAEALTLEPIAPAGTYTDPHSVVSDPSNPDRLFVAERTGLIKLTQDGTTTTFTDLTAVVNSTGDQQGIQSIAVPPDYAASGLLYVFYTGHDGNDGTPPAGNLHVGVLQADGDTADPDTLEDVITVVHDQGDGHNGGQIAFGPDGYLYMSTGDGKCCGDPLENGQNVNTLLGKVLRIIPQPDGSAGYSVPADNPFAGSIPGAGEIWSYGLRNPWRFSFDHLAGGLLIGDVGNANWEEVNYQSAAAGSAKGANFGWDCKEGMFDFTDAQSQANCPGQSFTDPALAYPHSQPPSQCDGSITGGYVVRDTALGELLGRYLYADFCFRELRSLVPGTTASGDKSEGFLDPGAHPLSFGEDSACRIYVITYDDNIQRLVGDGPSACQQPPPPAEPAAASGPSASELKLKAARRRVERGRRAKLTASVWPCAGRGDDEVTLLRAGAALATKSLGDDCAALFRPRIRRQWKFKARVPGDAEHLGDTSNTLKIRVRPGT